MFKIIASFAAENMGNKGVIRCEQAKHYCIAVKGGTQKGKYLRN